MSDASDNDFFDDICSRVGDLVCLWVCVGVYRGERLMTDQEINEAIAVKLGWATDGTDWYSPQGLKCNMAGNLPDYCHSIAAAWEIWDHFHEMATLTKHEGKWMLDYGRRFRIVADTAPRAICLAFLKLGLDKSAKPE